MKTAEPEFISSNTIPPLWATASALLKNTRIAEIDNFLPTFPEAIYSNIEEVEITKELLWDDAAHSEPNEEEKSRKNIITVIYAVKIKKIQKNCKSIFPKAF